MDIKNEYNEKRGVFSIEEEGKRIGGMTYTFAAPTKFIIEHTEVFPGNENKGYGAMLVKAAVDFARAKGFKIGLHCPYAQKVFARTPEYADVLS